MQSAKQPQLKKLCIDCRLNTRYIVPQEREIISTVNKT